MNKITQEAVLSCLQDSPAPLYLREIAKALSLSPAAREELKPLIAAMASDGLIHVDERRLIRLPTHMPEVCMAEVLAYDDDGYGSIRILSDDISEELIARSDIVLAPERKRGRIPRIGAKILVRMTAYGPDQYEARVLRILPDRKETIFGRIVAFRGGFGIEVAEKGARQIVPLAPDRDAPQLDDLIEAEFLPAKGRISKTAKMIKNFGSGETADAYIQLAIAEFGIPHIFSDSILQSTAHATVPEQAHRVDLRDLPLVTIDGADAKDFDDAVFAEPVSGGWRLIVAIADVSAYVTAGSELDIEAQKRGNSVYLPGTVIPMLPESLSNGVCSLVPHEDRASLAVEIFIDEAGVRQSHRFMRCLITSRARLIYDDVQAVYEGTLDEDAIGAPAGALHHLFGVWHLLHAMREKRGTLNLSVPEKRVMLSESGKPAEITVREQKPAHQLIEEFMILANICAAEELEAKQAACVYRTHDRPDMEKIEGLREMAEALEIPFAKGQVITPHRFNQLLASVKDTAEEQMVNDAVLRCQSRAVYDCENNGHYGLSLTRYAHFTSPIRRYADLLVHRAIIETNRLGPERQLLQNRDELRALCGQISASEQVAAKAERRTTDRLIAVLYQPQIGRQCDATITGLANFGLFASFDDRAAEGFIPFRSLPEDFYELDHGNSRLAGRRYGTVFKLGDVITVQIQSVEPASGGILLTYLDGGTTDKRVIKSKKRRHGAPNGKKSAPKKAAKRSKRRR